MDGTEGSGSSNLALEIVRGMAGRRFGFCGFDRGEAQRIEAVMRECGAFAVSFHDDVLAQSAHFCDALAIRVLGLGAGALQAAAALNMPVLASIPGKALAGGAGGAYAWPRDFMLEPWTRCS
jgi:hypothetical protein